MAAEEGEVAAAAVPGRRGSCPGAHRGRGCWNVGWRGGAGRGHRRRRSLRPRTRGTGCVLENTLFRPQQGSEDAAVQDVRSANNISLFRGGFPNGFSSVQHLTSSCEGFEV